MGPNTFALLFMVWNLDRCALLSPNDPPYAKPVCLAETLACLTHINNVPLSTSSPRTPHSCAELHTRLHLASSIRPNCPLVRNLYAPRLFVVLD
ncbi:hypothetical protein C8R45DRAFT_1014744 [Mycena sanguinolenta]|nr:hypothetical protein C8R45DRAFT_1014744 [Mycena sanguinolenta]